MAHLREDIEYPPNMNPYFRRVSCQIDPELASTGVAAAGSNGSTSSQRVGNPPVVNHGDVEVRLVIPSDLLVPWMEASTRVVATRYSLKVNQDFLG